MQDILSDFARRVQSAPFRQFRISGQRSLRHDVYCVENMENFHSFAISRIQEKLFCKI